MPWNNIWMYKSVHKHHAHTECVMVTSFIGFSCYSHSLSSSHLVRCICVDCMYICVCVARHLILSRFWLHVAKRWVGRSIGRFVGALTLCILSLSQFAAVVVIFLLLYIRTRYEFACLYCGVVCALDMCLCVEFTSTSVHSFMTLAFIYLLWYSGWVCCFFISNCCSVCFSRVCVVIWLQIFVHSFRVMLYFC